MIPNTGPSSKFPPARISLSPCSSFPDDEVEPEPVVEEVHLGGDLLLRLPGLLLRHLAAHQARAHRHHLAHDRPGERRKEESVFQTMSSRAQKRAGIEIYFFAIYF